MIVEGREEVGRERRDRRKGREDMHEGSSP